MFIHLTWILFFYILIDKKNNYFFCLPILLLFGIHNSLRNYIDSNLIYYVQFLFLLAVFFWERFFLSNTIDRIKKIEYSIDNKKLFYLCILFIDIVFLFLFKLNLDFLSQYLFAILMISIIHNNSKFEKYLLILNFLIVLFFIYNFPIDPIQLTIDTKFKNFFLFFLRSGFIFYVMIFFYIQLYFQKKNLIYLKYLLIFGIIIFFTILSGYIESSQFQNQTNITNYLSDKDYSSFFTIFYSKIVNRSDWLFSYIWEFGSINFTEINLVNNFNLSQKIFSPANYILGLLGIGIYEPIEIGKYFRSFYFNETELSFNIDLVSWIFIKNSSNYFSLCLDIVIICLIYFTNIFLFLKFNFKYYIFNFIYLINLLISFSYYMSSFYTDRYLDIMFFILLLNLSILFLNTFLNEKK